MKRTKIKPKPKRSVDIGPRPDPDGVFWHSIRKTLFDRCGWRCERCGCDLYATGMQAHHRLLRSQGGADEVVNLAALCPDCHTGSNGVHNRRVAAEQRGFIVPAWHHEPAQYAMVLHDGRTVRLLDDGTYDVWFDQPGDKTPTQKEPA